MWYQRRCWQKKKEKKKKKKQQQQQERAATIVDHEQPLSEQKFQLITFLPQFVHDWYK